MKKIVCVLMILMLISGCFPINALEGVVTTFIDFEGTSVPDIFTRRGGAVRIVPGMAADGIGNACFMQWGSTYYINDGNSWVNTDAHIF